jgi:RNA polymerase sigma-70 factor, ECF subfamily
VGRIGCPPRRAEMRGILERRIDELPFALRTVFAMRELAGMSGRETAHALGISEATVRRRLFRARALLREGLGRDFDRATIDLFGLTRERSERIVASVMAKLP